MTLIGDCPEHIRRDLQAIIARSAAIDDPDMKALARALPDLITDYIDKGALYTKRQAMRSRAYIESEPERQMAMGQRWFATEGARL